MNNLQIFNNDQFGSVRVVMQDGEPWFVAADVCRCLEIGDTQSALRRLDDDEKGADSIRTPGGVQKMLVVNEPGLYTLVLGSRKPEAKVFKRWITHEVIPSIRKTGSYSTNLTPAELILVQAQQLVDQERRLRAQEQKMHAVEDDLSELKNEIAHPINYFSIAGYANKVHMPVDHETACYFGKKAASLSRERRYMIGKISDPRYGTVNTYHKDILKEVFPAVCEVLREV